jgi:mRNA interferase MazF
MVRKGEVYYIQIDDAIGSEQSGLRPALVIQNNIGNKYSPTTIIAFITTQDKKPDMPTHVTLDDYCGLPQKSIVMLEQIRTIDKTRLRERVGRCSRFTMSKVNEAIEKSFFLTDEE